MRSNSRPIGYLEVQHGWIPGSPGAGDFLETYEDVVREIVLKTRRERPDLKHIETRLESVHDGSMVLHLNVYCGFAPITSSAEPLDASNLNSAKNPQIGNPTHDVVLGMKERRF